MIKWLAFTILFATPVHASKGVGFRASGDLEPEDYRWQGYGEVRDSIFNAPEVSLDLDIGITSDCGKIDIKGTVQGALKNILNAKYFKDLGTSIVGASPMLLTCYLSPTWCAILKKFRAQANMLAQLRLNQCKAIDKCAPSRLHV